ncbi:hypothetical protein V3H18_05135 [Methylocystis sp. 9N]|uniref:HTH luxR-type domain-containing protein n=1 Tax=Methylocystis borbori TaxID=3118750 RepID=A0ABU7XEV9_9HYPH
MDYILDSASNAPPTEDEVNQVIATSRRRERHRGSRRVPLVEDIATAAHPDGALTARRELEAIRRKVGVRNWELLTAVGIGSDYKEISVAMSVLQGTVRVKVMRLRASLADAA